MSRVIGQTTNSNVITGVEELNPAAYIVEIDTAFGINNHQISLPIQGSNMTIDWGDGTVSTGVTQAAVPSAANVITHNYGGVTRRLVQITGGLQRVAFMIEHTVITADQSKVVSHVQWGTTAWISMHTMYRRCSNLSVFHDTTSPNLSAASNISGIFREVNMADWLFLQNWNTQTISNFSWLFWLSNFNAFLGNWDIRAATDMSFMLGTSWISPENYTDTFVAWANQIVTRGGSPLSPINVNATSQTGRTFVGSRSGGVHFPNALAARTFLTTPTGSGGAGWTISGDTLT